MIKSINTKYNGYLFRSRLEARWAVFFDAAGIDYIYEPEGFELEDGTRYLPDFYLPEYDWYVEVKPPRENAADEINRARRFVGEKIKVLLLLGNLPKKHPYECYHYSVLYFNPLREMVLCERVTFGIGYEDEEESPHIRIHTWLAVDRMMGREAWWAIDDSKIMRILTPKPDMEIYGENGLGLSYAESLTEDELKFMSNAYDKARQARFEYGDKGIENAK